MGHLFWPGSLGDVFRGHVGAPLAGSWRLGCRRKARKQPLRNKGATRGPLNSALSGGLTQRNDSLPEFVAIEPDVRLFFGHFQKGDCGWQGVRPS